MDYIFSVQELAKVVPRDVYRWFCFKVYGTDQPGHDEKPIYGSSNSLLTYKKQISYFVTAINITAWNELTKTGNPTRSQLVNDLISLIKKKECRGMGKESKADRPFEREEFKQVLDILSSSEDFDKRYRYTTMLKYMVHLIARGDDASHVFASTLAVSTQYPWTIVTRLRWSKNVRERRGCPIQILLGSMDPNYCVLLALAIWLEHWVERGEGAVSQWMFADGITNRTSPVKDQKKEADRCKDGLYNALVQVFADERFTAMVTGPEAGRLGVHSTKKYGTTICKGRGKKKAHTDYRARWKNKDMQSHYADTFLPWPDIDAASALCFGGICVYKLKEGCGLSDEWLIEHVAPSIRAKFGDQVAAVLAKPLLWACLDDDCAEMVPEYIRARIITALDEVSEANNLPDGENVVDKVYTIVREVEGEVVFTEVPSDLRSGAPIGDGEWKTAMLAKVVSTQRTSIDTQNTVTSYMHDISKRLRRVEQNQQRSEMFRFSRAAGRGRVLAGGVGRPREERLNPANLSACPKTLYDLWAEYTTGLGGNKAACEFTTRERGKFKYMYCRRKIVWDTISDMCERNMSADTAIDRIYVECGGMNTPVNKVINALKQFRREGNAHLFITAGRR